VIVRGVHAALRVLDWPKARAFARAMARPDEVQARRLRALLRHNAVTAYGTAHGYARIGSVHDFQRLVPVIGGAELTPWVDRIAAGEACVLTREPVRMLERTSGSAGGDKLVPFTPAFLRELRSALAPWLWDLSRAHPRLLGLRQYWSISPAARRPESSVGGVPIGLEDDTEYLGPLSRAAMRTILAVPSEVARAASIEAWRRQTLRHLLCADDLGLLSVWSPSFLTALMQALERDLPDHLAALSPQRASQLGRRLDAAGRLCGEALWPKLQVISCWADGPARGQLAGLRRYFPTTAIQGKGLLATEGVVSFPLWGQEAGAVAAATSHFLEFIDLDQPTARPRLVHELHVGGAYSPLLTTGAGLTRYHLQDVLRCTGHVAALPLLRFEGKLDKVSDRAGEKLGAARVEAALGRVGAQLGVGFEFALLAPVEEGGLVAYVLFVESDAPDDALAALAQALEEDLCGDHHYGYCRRLGQLGPIKARRVHQGWEAYQKALVARGARLGDIKPVYLDGRLSWDAVFVAAS
jgi:hypothetical protein